MQPSAVGQYRVDVGQRIVQPPTGLAGEPAGEPADRGVGLEADRCSFQSAAPIQIDLLGRIDQHVGDARLGQHRLQRTGAEQFGAKLTGQLGQGRLVQQQLGSSSGQLGQRTGVGGQPQP